MKFNKIKKVQIKFLICILPTISIILCLLAFFTYQQSKKEQIKSTDDYSTQIVKAKGGEIEKWLYSLVVELQQIAARRDVQTMDWKLMQEDIKSIAEKRIDTYGFLILIEKDGNYYSTLKDKADKKLDDKDYFKAVVLEGKNYSISNPYNSVTTGKPIFVVNVPIRNKRGELLGCLGGIVYLNTLSKIAANIKIGENGYGWIVDNEGLVVAHPDSNLVLKFNVLKSSESGFKQLDKVGADMLKKPNGIGLITRPDHVEEYLSYSKIPLSPNWTLGVAVPTNQIYSKLDVMLSQLVIFFIITLVVISILIWLLSKIIITRPLNTLIQFTHSISEGKLYKNIAINSIDEVGTMALSLKNMSNKLREITERIISSSLNIASGSHELSIVASQVSDGASQQAASSEEISASIEEMGSIIGQNTENSEITEKTALKAAADIEEVLAVVRKTIGAIRLIASKITIVSEIAGRTDILAMNAAIEAAKAGEKGKGFAVVANEVRKLAINSKTAAVEINEISASTVGIAEKSGALLEAAVPVIRKNADLVREINASSIEQNTGAEQINNAIQELTQVTQRNSAAAEQMATGSEELAEQAAMLKDIISFFKIKEEDEAGNMADIAYQKMLEAISVFEQYKASYDQSKSSVRIPYIEHAPTQEQAAKGININMKNAHEDDFERM